MISNILKLLETFGALARERQKNSREYFEHYAKPAFELSQLVFKDYLVVLADVKRRIANGESRMSLLQHLEQSRVEYLPVRIQLRAMMRLNALRAWPEEQRSFECGVMGLLQGGLLHLEETEVVRRYCIYFSNHTLLDILSVVAVRENEIPDSELLQLFSYQEEALQKAFRDVTWGFEELRQVMIPVVPKPKKEGSYVYRREGD